MNQQLPKSPISSTNTNFNTRIPYKDRIPLCNNPVTQRLLAIIDEKKTNLAHNPDVTSKAEFLSLVDKIGPYICVLKTHVDLIEDFDWDLIEQLKELAATHNFLIFEDRKFADIGYVSGLQLTKSLYRISEWADMVTVHAIPGPGIFDGLYAAAPHMGFILLPQMSSAGNLATGNYTQQTMALAQRFESSVVGIIARNQLIDNPGYIHFGPGVKLQKGSDTFGQAYLTPQKVIADGIDVIIVGRGIYQAEDPIAAAQDYQHAGWQAYEESL